MTNIAKATIRCLVVGHVVVFLWAVLLACWVIHAIAAVTTIPVHATIRWAFFDEPWRGAYVRLFRQFDIG